MSDTKSRSFTEDFKRFFVRGLVILLPSVLTLWIVVKAYGFIDDAIAEPINKGVRTALIEGGRVWDPLDRFFAPDEEEVVAAFDALKPADRTDEDAARAEIRMELRAANVRTWWDDHKYMDVIGLFVAIITVYIAGRLLGGFVGRRLYRHIEVLITRLPVFKQVYPYVKQIVDFLFSDEQPIKFNRVVAVEYPRKGIWSVGFLTGGSLKSVADSAGPSRTIFIPSSPTPFTGYTITVRVEDIIEIPISVDEAIRFAVSGGVLVPDHQATPDSPGGLNAVDGLIPIPSMPKDSDGEDDSSARTGHNGGEQAPSPEQPDDDSASSKDS